LIDACAALAQTEGRVKEMAQQMKGVEADVQDMRSKAKIAVDKLYGGTVKNPKELVSLKEQVESYNKKIAGLEDQTLGLMTEMDALEKEVAAKRQQLVVVEDGWAKDQQALLKQKDELIAAIAGIEPRRKEAASQIDQASISLYENLRKRRQGRGVSKVEQGMCQGCRIHLPVNKLQQLRAGHNLVQCSCERILYLS
jgi:predicted  nucleic acid-binding Zn-ribbon protein